MTEPVRVFPDVQTVLIDDLVRFVGGRDDGTGYTAPADLGAKLPFIRVRRTGGSNDGLNDYPTVDVDVFGASYSEAINLARRVDAYLVNGGGAPPIPAFDTVINTNGPHELPWDDEGAIRRFGLEYDITTRRRVLI